MRITLWSEMILGVMRGAVVTPSRKHLAGPRPHYPNRPPLWRGFVGVQGCVYALLACVVFLFSETAYAAEPRHAITMHGEPALPAGFTRLPYANPNAPKGGRITYGLLGTFDSLNPLIVKGIALPAIRGYVIESLMARGYDEPFTLYGLVAKSVETDDARSYVTFTIDSAARF